LSGARNLRLDRKADSSPLKRLRMTRMMRGVRSGPTVPRCLEQEKQKPRWSGGAWQMPVGTLPFKTHYNSRCKSRGRAEDPFDSSPAVTRSGQAIQQRPLDYLKGSVQYPLATSSKRGPFLGQYSMNPESAQVHKSRCEHFQNGNSKSRFLGPLEMARW
jgi:hypothetical protein